MLVVLYRDLAQVTYPRRLAMKGYLDLPLASLVLAGYDTQGLLWFISAQFDFLFDYPGLLEFAFGLQRDQVEYIALDFEESRKSPRSLRLPRKNTEEPRH